MTEHSQPDVADQSDAKPDSVEARRRFLAKCGKFAVITPPTIAVLLSSTSQSYATAGSGHRRKRHHKWW